MNASETKAWARSELRAEEYWGNRSNGHDTALLACVALALINIAPSEAAVERSFSVQGRIHSKNRNRTLPDAVEAQTMLAMNCVGWPTVQRSVTKILTTLKKSQQKQVVLPGALSPGLESDVREVLRSFGCVQNETERCLEVAPTQSQ